MAVSRTFGTNLTAGVANIIYEARSTIKSANVLLLYISNNDINNKKIAVSWYDASTNESYYIINGYALTANQYIKLDGSYINLKAGDKIIATPETGSVMASIITVEEEE